MAIYAYGFGEPDLREEPDPLDPDHEVERCKRCGRTFYADEGCDDCAVGSTTIDDEEG